MENHNAEVLEGVFAIAKPALVSSADVLQKLQSTFASSQIFAPLRSAQPKRSSKDESQIFRMGHGGTLDPIASGVLIVGIGRGTKQLQQFLSCSKTYETVVLFGASTDSYDCTGTVIERATVGHITQTYVEQQLVQFRGTFHQLPPVFSALKINGIKACEYARQGKELPRQLESREMHVEECTLLEWYEPGGHQFAWPGDSVSAPAPAARIRLTVCSGFYVRSFAHDLGIACQTRSYMASLLRTRQAGFTISTPSNTIDLIPAIEYVDLEAGEEAWGPKLQPQLENWVTANPTRDGHINGRDRITKQTLAAEAEMRPKQRFRGEWVAETKKERINQQGGKFKGKWNRQASRVEPIKLLDMKK